MIKVALALQHREVPPNLHFTEPNPHIPFDRLPLRVQTALGPWPVESGPALAGVSSFGFGGTNAHVVLEAAPSSNSENRSADRGIENREVGDRNTGHLLPLSARSPEALQSLARAYQDFLATPESERALDDICYTASIRRSHHDYRLAVTGNSREQLSDGYRLSCSESRVPVCPPAAKMRAVRESSSSCFRDKDRNGSAWGEVS